MHIALATILAPLLPLGAFAFQESTKELREEVQIFEPRIVRDFETLRPYTDRRAVAVDTVVRHTICLGTKRPGEAHHVCGWDRRDPYDVAEIIKLLRSLRLSVHYVIARDGTIYHLVPEQRAGRHAGHSQMPENGRTRVNRFSIGIEVVNMEGDDPTSQQAVSLRWLLSDIRSRYDDLTVVDHRDIRDGRQDPTWSTKFQELSAAW